MRTLALLSLVTLSSCGVAPVDQTAPPVLYDATADPGEVRDLSVRESQRRIGYVAHDHRHPRAVLVLGGVFAHSGWFPALAEELDQRGFDLHCLDPRGMGINRENRGFESGWASSYSHWLDDVDGLLDVLQARYETVYLGGHSFGGRLALAYALAHPDRVAGTVLIAPTLRWADGSWSSYRLGQYLVRTTDPRVAYDVEVQPADLTDEPPLRVKIERDPLRLTQVTNGACTANIAIQGFFDEALPKPGLPTLLLLGENDRLIGNTATQAWLAAALAEGLITSILPGRGHALALEAPDEVARLIAQWADRR